MSVDVHRCVFCVQMDMQGLKVVLLQSVHT
jgi:hypothetical protein